MIELAILGAVLCAAGAFLVHRTQQDEVKDQQYYELLNFSIMVFMVGVGLCLIALGMAVGL